MRLTVVLQAQHIGNAFKKVWKVQSNRKILDFGVREQLESKKKVQVVDALEFLGLKPATVPPQTFNIEYIIVVHIHANHVTISWFYCYRTPKSLDGAIDDSLLPKPITNDKSHPDWHNQQCSIYDEYSSLVAGLDQGLNLTKTILAGRELPERINATKHENLSDEIHNKVQQYLDLTMFFHFNLNQIVNEFALSLSLKGPFWMPIYWMQFRRSCPEMCTRTSNTAEYFRENTAYLNGGESMIFI